MHNAVTKKKPPEYQSVATLLLACLSPVTILAPVEEKPTYSLVFPLWSALVSPVLTASADPHLPLQLLPPHPAPPPLKSLAVLWSGATPPLTQGIGPPREGWAIPESLWCAALCPSVLMVQSPLRKTTWELHSSAWITHSGRTETPCTPTVRVCCSRSCQCNVAPEKARCCKFQLRDG